MANLGAQLIRYGLVGLTNNLLIYVGYLVLSDIFMIAPKVSMTITYVSGVLLSYSMNKQWTFRFAGAKARSFSRFIAVHIFGYFLNLLILWLCVDHLGYPHQVVQGGAILLVAIILFVLFKYFVFTKEPVEPVEAGQS
jgi:putative flippase GtrA